jgi:hypothetical protein
MPAQKLPLDYLSQLDTLPPRICFAVSRSGRRAMTQQDIAEKTGWSLKKVAKIARLDSWATVTVADADTFRRATGCDRKQERRQKFFLRRSLTQNLNGLNHIRKTGRMPKWMQELTEKNVEEIS